MATKTMSENDKIKAIEEIATRDHKDTLKRSLCNEPAAIELLHATYQEIDSFMEPYLAKKWRKVSYKVGIAFGYIYGYVCLQRDGILGHQCSKFVYHDIPILEEVDEDDC